MGFSGGIFDTRLKHFIKHFIHFVNCNIHTYNIVYNTNGTRMQAERLYSSSQ